MFGFLEKFRAPQPQEQQENEIEVLQKQIATLQPEDLKMLANEKANEIFSRVKEIGKSIEEARKITEKAKYVENGLLDTLNPFADSEADKRSKLNTQAITKQNQAMAEMNTLIQESIKLTTISYGFAQAMTQTIAEMLANGFEDRDGHTQKLQGVAREQAEFMLVEAQKFVQHQSAYEERQAKQEQDIATQGEKIKDIRARLESKDSIDKEQSRNIKSLQNELKEKREKITRLEQQLDTKQNIDEEQSRDIQSLQNAMQEKREKITHLQKQLDIKQGIDEGQEAKISELQNRVRDLEKSSGKMSLTLSIVALLAGIGSIILQFLR